jgi:hypothetical protein
MRFGRPIVVLLLFVYGGCAGARIRHVDERSRVCVLDDGTRAAYVPPGVKHSGAHPRIPRETPASDARRGVYDCLISAAGALVRCRVLQSLGGGDQGVIDGLGTWTFEPARCAERAVDGSTIVEVTPRWIPSCVNVSSEERARAARRPQSPTRRNGSSKSAAHDP